MSIVIVENDETNLAIIEKILIDAGYDDILTAPTATQLFDLLGHESDGLGNSSVNLILMDMVTDGIEATKRIQRIERLRDIPIIIVTAVGDSNQLAEALDAGATDYVMKPINKIELLARIRSALKLKFQKDRHKERDKRLKFELDLAKRVQYSVLNDPLDDENVMIRGVCRPSFELAGDFYAWYPIDQHRYGIILLDMMGHGISSSLVCMYISSILQDAIKRYCDPTKVIKQINRYMNRLEMTDELNNYYFTAIYVLLDTEQKTIEYVNAGHPPGIAYVDDSVKLLSASSSAVGFFENIEVNKETLHYTEQCKLVLFTDGLIDINFGDAVDGVDKLTDELIQHQDLDFSALVQHFIPNKKVADQHDDICLVMITSK